MHWDGSRGWGWGGRSLHLMRKNVNRLMIIPVPILVDGDRNSRNLINLLRLLMDSGPVIIIRYQLFVLTILALASARIVMYP